MSQDLDSEHKRESDIPEAVSNGIARRDKLVHDTNDLVLQTLQKLGRRNFRLYVTGTIASLLLTLFITVVGLLDEAVISANQRKVATGILGAILATLQTAVASFNLKRKYEGYFSLEVEGKGLLLDIDYAEGKVDLAKCKERLHNLRTSALKLEL
jgi:hypothetical protein